MTMKHDCHQESDDRYKEIVKDLKELDLREREDNDWSKDDDKMREELQQERSEIEANELYEDIMKDKYGEDWEKGR